MDKSGVIASTCDDLFDAIFFAESFCTTNELNLDAVFGGQMLSVGSNLVAQRLRETSEVEYLDVMRTEIEAHSIRVAPAGNRAGDNDAVEARETPGDLLGIAIL